MVKVLGVLLCAIYSTILYSETIVLVDRSGSMSGGRSSPFEVARGKISQIIIPRIAEDNTAIWSFGGNCGSLDKARFTKNRAELHQQVRGLASPRGGTPLHKATERAVRALGNYRKDKNLIVLTDGQDSCGGDPCQVIIAARKAGIDITVHTIGIGMKSNSRASLDLQCMSAESVDGYHANVSLAQGDSVLAKAVDEISDRIIKRRVGSLLVVSKSSDGSEKSHSMQLKSLSSGATFTIEAGKVTKLPTGNYVITTGQEERHITIRSQVQTKEIFFSKLGVINVRNSCPNSPIKSVELTSPEFKKMIRSGKSYELPAGQYLLSVNGQANKGVNVQASSVKDITLPAWGKIQLSSSVSSELTAAVMKVGNQVPITELSIGKSTWLPVGEYNVRPSADNPGGFLPIHRIRVKACETTDAQLVSVANLTILCKKRLNVSIYDKGTLIHSGTSGETFFLSKKGRYRVNMLGSNGEKYQSIIRVANDTKVSCENFSKF